MNSPYTKEEQETIILFDNSSPIASVYTFDSRMKRQLTKYADKFPDECILESVSKHGFASTYKLPKKRIRISIPSVYTEEQKKKQAEHMRQVAQNKASASKD